MKTSQKIAAGVVALGTAGLTAYALQSSSGSTAPGPPSGASARPLAAVAADGSISDAGGPAPSFKCPNTFVSVPIAPGVPSDSSGVFANQSQADCFAWQEFIALNWSSAGGGAGTFGDPGDPAPTTWETYMDAHLLYQPNAATPPPWGSQPAVPDDCARQAGFAPGAKVPRRVRMTTKFSSDFGPKDTGQAAPQGAPNWLASQSGRNVWYEVRIGEDEYDFVTDAGLYNADNQAAYVDSGAPLLMPKGKYGDAGPVGAIELKAAWIEAAPNPSDAKWKTYKLTPAIVVDPTTNQCRATTLALVGLHVIHKTTTQPTWVWATFEHLNNAPDDSVARAGKVPADAGYDFYNPSCTPVTTDAGCGLDGGTATVGCTPNQSPPYYLGPGCPPVPIQVTRVNPVDSTAQAVNALAQSTIAGANADSVWQYYQLVNVIWSGSPVADPPDAAPVPRNLGSAMDPTNFPVASSVLETYVQATGCGSNGQGPCTCTDCHQYAAIASTAANQNPTWQSDLGFAIGTADFPHPDAGATGSAALKSAASFRSHRVNR